MGLIHEYHAGLCSRLQLRALTAAYPEGSRLTLSSRLNIRVIQFTQSLKLAHGIGYSIILTTLVLTVHFLNKTTMVVANRIVVAAKNGF